MLTFNSEVRIKSHPDLEILWNEKEILRTYRHFQYNNDNKIHPPQTNFSNGKFEISIPSLNQLNSGCYIIANGTLQGDFEVTCLLILYDLNEDLITVHHYKKKDINVGNNNWNNMLSNKKTAANQNYAAKALPNLTRLTTRSHGD